MSQRIVIALGGNSLLKKNEAGTFQQQMENVSRAVHNLAPAIAQGYQIVLIHGNGPQVGNLLIQSEVAVEKTPAMPLDALVAQTQGMIGYMIQQSLGNEFRKQGVDRNVVSVVTQVEVNPNDKAFDEPTKFVGPFLTETQAKQFASDEIIIKQDADRGWRRVVPSPRPLRIVESSVISHLVDYGAIVVAVGGGGIPVVQSPDQPHAYRGVEAVIDKDLAAHLLAQAVGADTLLMLTAVSAVKVDFGTPDERDLGEVDVETMSHFLAEGQFPPGSMGPKVEAAIEFVRQTGGSAIITSMDHISEAIRGETGTRIVPSPA